MHYIATMLYVHAGMLPIEVSINSLPEVVAISKNNTEVINMYSTLHIFTE